MELEKLLEDNKFVDYVINRFLPFKIIYRMLDVDYNDRGNNFCIFHDNSNTPSARIYHNDTGDSLYCYSEGKSYKPSQAFRRGLISHRIETIAYNILKQFDETQIQALLDEFGVGIDIKPTFTEEQLSDLNKFKNNDITVQQFNKTLINILYFGG